jgi:hypothetical protein
MGDVCFGGANVGAAYLETRPEAFCPGVINSAGLCDVPVPVVANFSLQFDVPEVFTALLGTCPDDAHDPFAAMLRVETRREISGQE